MAIKISKIEEILDLVNKPKRPMPAYFTSSSDRKKTFLVDYPIFEVDEYEMASVAMDAISELLGIFKLTSQETYAIIRCGEDIMLASFIIAKEHQDSNEKELMHAVIKIILKVKKNAESLFPDYKIMHDPGLYHIERYYCECARFAVERAVGIKLPLDSEKKIFIVEE